MIEFSKGWRMAEKRYIQRDEFHKLTADLDDLVKRAGHRSNNPQALQALRDGIQNLMSELPKIDAEEGALVEIAENPYQAFREFQTQVRIAREVYL